MTKVPEKSQNSKQIIKALTTISEAVISDQYLDDILKLIVTVTAEVMGSKICSLMMTSDSGKELVVKATQSVSEAYNKKPDIKVGEGIAGLVAKTAKTISSKDVREDERYKNRDIAKKEKLCSLLSVPLIYKGKAIGVLNSYTAKPHEYSENEVNILKSVANQAAIVIENFRLVVETEVIKEELETRKLIERAKGILMRNKGLSEDAAYKFMRKYSMDSRKTMKGIAEAVILNEEMSKIS